MKNQNCWIQTGITPEGKPVLAGVYRFYETHGLPLDIILMCFHDKGWVPDWIDFYQDAREAGMQHKRILSKLAPAIADSYGKEWKEGVISTLDSLFKEKI